MAERKHSRQREVIRELLQGRTDHPTAEQIYEEAKTAGHTISLGTVYRNLSVLEDCKELNRISYLKGPDRYDANVRPHHHFVCRSCGKVMDVDIPLEEKPVLQQIKALQEVGEADCVMVTFTGICRECISRRQKEEG